LWVIASAGFNLYVSNFGSYANTYGNLAGVIVFLIWLWLTNMAILFGAQFAEELERTALAAREAEPTDAFAPFPGHEDGEESAPPHREADATPSGGGPAGSSR
jgi:uncharacterized BrkB/YihY/UPF0761 family membrane protein